MNAVDYALAIASGEDYPFIHVRIAAESSGDIWELHLLPTDIDNPIPARGQTMIVDNLADVYLGELLHNLINADPLRIVTLHKQIALKIESGNFDYVSIDLTRQRMAKLRAETMAKIRSRISFDWYDLISEEKARERAAA